MPKRTSREWLNRVARGLTGGALALSTLSLSGAGLATVSPKTVSADDLDCYNDRDVYYMPECVERRALDEKTGNQRNESQGAGGPTSSNQPPAGGGPTESQNNNPPPSTNNNPPPSGGGNTEGGNPPANNTANNNPPPSNNNSQPAANNPPPSNQDGGEQTNVPRGPLTDPWQVVLTMADAGKESTQYINDEGTDKWGKWARTRFERDRSNGASTLGPNVIDSKVWITKDANAAKDLFKEQAAVKNFPERKEGVTGPVENAKPTKYGEQFSMVASYFQDDKVWQHYRFVIQQGNVVSILYLFGREEFFLDPKDKNWTGQGDWYTAALFHRM